MGPVVIGGNVWRVVRVSPGDPFLVDRTGSRRIATADISSKTIRISEDIMPPLLDKVLLHEVAHAAIDGSPVADILRGLPDNLQSILAEELLAWFMETHAIEVIDAASSLLGRKVCVDGLCIGGSEWR